jgi:DNA-binding response OmpR family regulator
VVVVDRSDTRIVLLVEDDASLRRILTEFVESRGFRVRSAASGEEALNFLESLDGAPSLLVSDLMLPGMNGIALCEWVRAHARYRTLPIIVVTGAGEPWVEQVRALANDVVPKPFSVEHLGACLARWAP